MRVSYIFLFAPRNKKSYIATPACVIDSAEINAGAP